MNIKQLKKLQSLRNKLFEAMVFDTNPENWVAYAKPAKELSKQEKDEAAWCRRQAASSIALWEKIDKLIVQHSEPKSTINIENTQLDLLAVEEEAKTLLVQIGANNDS
ncbi:hypothetical protein [Entomomonas asaccharolytica]|uniref:Uncharacterized protein n=1 Tax=Entomomonas asaccharolytica TaxID=2785331 RepID=A0A974NDU6_9GAMM|nr:hypothetical protein [Entomomonas asaccharolytica]QQP84698.1 hypothetical protein JHT90_09785 [Entomomonas asaccharolytica]